MLNSELRRLVRKLFLLMVLCATLVAVSFSRQVPQVSACQSCFSESADAYVYCRDHYDPNNPDTWMYYGCNFNYACPASSANQVYRDECLLH